MKQSKSGTSISVKLYLFITLTVLLTALGMAILSYRINAGQIDRYYKESAYDSAVNFASLVDGDYLAKLRAAAESEEFQRIREAAEEADDEQMIQEYLEAHGLWEGYTENRNKLIKYLGNMSAIKYLYIIAIGDMDALYDMYLIDDDENPIYETGYYEEREPEPRGIDCTKTVEPTISTGDWGWLCSAYAPVYDSSGNLVCQIGCDYSMDEVMAERHRALLYIILTAIGLTLIVLIGAGVLINRTVIHPLDSLTAEMTKFRPTVNASYTEAGVADLDINSRDEINELYSGIRTMQMSIVDYLNDLDTLQKDKERAEESIRSRDEQIGQISKEVYVDVLTGVGSKAAYTKKADELNAGIAAGNRQFGIVMVDMNDLKMINDTYGHEKGDEYIKGCCRKICDTFKHSPVFRIGGDEFIAVVQGQDFKNLIALTGALKDTYRNTSADHDVSPWERYSAAVGTAVCTSADQSAEDVFKRADDAMYRDKNLYKQSFGSYR